jgi:hypothetical protein
VAAIERAGFVVGELQRFSFHGVSHVLEVARPPSPGGLGVTASATSPDE